MSAVMPTTTMPALGAQLASMVGCVNTCNRTIASMGEFASMEDIDSAWRRARDDVFVPFEVEGDTLSDDVYEARERLGFIIPQVREKFDERVGRIYQQPVTKSVIDEQKIDVDLVRRARDMEIISELPANALIQSAITYGTQPGTLRASSYMVALLTYVGGATLLEAVLAGVAIMKGEPLIGISLGTTSLVSAALFSIAARSMCEARDTQALLSDKWHEIFPKKEYKKSSRVRGLPSIPEHSIAGLRPRSLWLRVLMRGDEESRMRRTRRMRRR